VVPAGIASAMGRWQRRDQRTWQVILDDVGNVGNVQAASGHIGCHEDAHVVLLEVG